MKPSPEVVAAVTSLYPRLRRFFAGKLSVADAEDLTHATITTFLEKDGATGDAKHFLFGIARNKLLQHYARGRGGVAFDSHTMSIDKLETTLGTRIQRRLEVQACLSQLPLEQQIAVELRYGECLKLEEIAAEIGMSRSQVVRYIHDGLAAMRECLGRDLAEDQLGSLVEADYRAR